MYDLNNVGILKKEYETFTKYKLFHKLMPYKHNSSDLIIIGNGFINDIKNTFTSESNLNIYCKHNEYLKNRYGILREVILLNINPIEYITKGCSFPNYNLLENQSNYFNYENINLSKENFIYAILFESYIYYFDHIYQTHKSNLYSQRDFKYDFTLSEVPDILIINNNTSLEKIIINHENRNYKNIFINISRSQLYKTTNNVSANKSYYNAVSLEKQKNTANIVIQHLKNINLLDKNTNPSKAFYIPPNQNLVNPNQTSKKTNKGSLFTSQGIENESTSKNANFSFEDYFSGNKLTQNYKNLKIGLFWEFGNPTGMMTNICNTVLSEFEQNVIFIEQFYSNSNNLNIDSHFGNKYLYGRYFNSSFNVSNTYINLDKLESQAKQIFLQNKNIIDIIKISDKYDELKKMKDYYFEQAGELDGLLIPGGNDVESNFSGINNDITPSKDIRRTLAEIFMIHRCLELKIPILGICRGSQILNLYFGGSLKKVKGQQISDIIETTVSKNPSIKFEAYSNHSQAVKNLGSQLIETSYVLQKYNNEKIIKSFEGASNNIPVIGVQFHPETYNNYCFLKKFPSEVEIDLKLAESKQFRIHDKVYFKKLTDEFNLSEGKKNRAITIYKNIFISFLNRCGKERSIKKLNPNLGRFITVSGFIECIRKNNSDYPLYDFMVALQSASNTPKNLKYYAAICNALRNDINYEKFNNVDVNRIIFPTHTKKNNVKYNRYLKLFLTSPDGSIHNLENYFIEELFYCAKRYGSENTLSYIDLKARSDHFPPTEIYGLSCAGNIDTNYYYCKLLSEAKQEDLPDSGAIIYCIPIDKINNKTYDAGLSLLLKWVSAQHKRGKLKFIIHGAGTYGGESRSGGIGMATMHNNAIGDGVLDNKISKMNRVFYKDIASWLILSGLEKPNLNSNSGICTINVQSCIAGSFEENKGKMEKRKNGYQLRAADKSNIYYKNRLNPLEFSNRDEDKKPISQLELYRDLNPNLGYYKAEDAFYSENIYLKSGISQMKEEFEKKHFYGIEITGSANSIIIIDGVSYRCIEAEEIFNSNDYNEIGNKVITEIIINILIIEKVSNKILTNKDIFIKHYSELREIYKYYDTISKIYNDLSYKLSAFERLPHSPYKIREVTSVK